MRISIIDRYISQEIIVSWLSVLFVLVMVVASADAVHMLSWVAEGRIPADVLVALLIINLYEFSVMLVPLSLLLGVLLAFGRLYKDSEMTAVMSAGLGPVHWYRPLLLIALPVSLMSLVLTHFLLPSVAEQRDQIMTDVKNRTELSTLFAGRFNQSKEGNAIFFLESQSKDGRVMEHVFHRQSRDGVAHVDVAKRARNQTSENGHDYIVMENGTHYEGEPGSGQYRITDYAEYGVYVPESNVIASNTSVKAMSSKDLWHSNVPLHKAELQWRITIPVATFIIAMLALPLSYTTPRSGRYANLALAILLYLVYSNLLGMAKTWLIKGQVPIWIGTWWVHGLALIMLVVLLKMSGHSFRSRKKVKSDSARAAK